MFCLQSDRNFKDSKTYHVVSNSDCGRKKWVLHINGGKFIEPLTIGTDLMSGMITYRGSVDDETSFESGIVDQTVLGVSGAAPSANLKIFARKCDLQSEIRQHLIFFFLLDTFSWWFKS